MVNVLASLCRSEIFVAPLRTIWTDRYTANAIRLGFRFDRLGSPIYRNTIRVPPHSI